MSCRMLARGFERLFACKMRLIRTVPAASRHGRLRQLAILVEGPKNVQPQKAGHPKRSLISMNSLFERLRTRRLASTFASCHALRRDCGRLVLAHGVRGQEKQNDSTDATPLKVINSPVPPNEFVKIAKEVGPAVVNINTQTLPKQSATSSRNPHARQFDQNPSGGADDDDDDQRRPGPGSRAGPDNFQDFFNRFFGGQAPDQDGGAMTDRCASRSAPASSSTPRATSSPTITWSRRPTRSTSSSPPIPTLRTSDVRRA